MTDFSLDTAFSIQEFEWRSKLVRTHLPLAWLDAIREVGIFRVILGLIIEIFLFDTHVVHIVSLCWDLEGVVVTPSLSAAHAEYRGSNPACHPAVN